MKAGVLVLLLSCSLIFPERIHAQVIRGLVKDMESKEPVPYANVYFNSSMRGTSTDLDGNFQLSIRDFEGQDIVVSCVGYETWVLRQWKAGKFYHIYLLPSSKFLKEVYVLSHDMPRKKKEQMFLREFLGTTKNGMTCTIDNLEDVYLVYFKETKTLEGYCDKPLIIRNKALGYTIRYDLDLFKLEENNLFYQGYYLFEDDTTLTTRELNAAARKRKQAYLGSRMHLIREMWRKSTYKLDFRIQYTNSGNQVVLDSLITDQQNHTRFLNPVGELNVYYKNELSHIAFVGGVCVPFTKSGFFNSEHLQWSGKMAEERVGDLLPFEYWP